MKTPTIWAIIPDKISINEQFFETNSNKFSNVVNDYFTNIGNEMAAKIPPSNVIYTDTLQQNILSSFVIDDIDDVEVMNSIHSLKTKASPGLHGISAKYFKISNMVVSPVLAKLFNKCLQEENFSDTLKQSQIIPVPKINSPIALQTLDLFHCYLQSPKFLKKFYITV